MGAKVVHFNLLWLLKIQVLVTLLFFSNHACASGEEQGQQNNSVTREEFEELRGNVAEVNQKLDMILKAFVKDGYFAETFRGPPRNNAKSEPPGMKKEEGTARECSNATLTSILEKIERLERFHGFTTIESEGENGILSMQCGHVSGNL